MTITLEIPTNIEAPLRHRAAQAGQDEQTVALSLLTDILLAEPFESETTDEETPARSMADLFAGRVGVVAGSGEPYSENGGERFAAYLVRKRQSSLTTDTPDAPA